MPDAPAIAIVAPTATARAFGFAASSESASSRDRGRAYSTLARSIAVLYSFGVRPRKREQLQGADGGGLGSPPLSALFTKSRCPSRSAAGRRSDAGRAAGLSVTGRPWS